MSDVIEQFCAHHHSYNDISSDRRTMQKRELCAFAASLDGRSILEGDADDLTDYLASLIARGLAPSTVQRVRNAIRPFYTWAWERRLVDADRLMRMRNVKPPRGANQRKPRPYTRKEIAQLWADVAERFPLAEQKWLDRWRRGTSPWRRVESHAQRLQLECLVALALYGGLRRDEIWRLSIDDMHYENEYIVVRGARKNKDAEEKPRAVPLTDVPELHAAIKAWLDFRAEIDPPHDRPWLSLFRQHHLKPAQKRTFNTTLGKTGGWSFHRLRHTAITEMLRAGYELQAVKEIAGHSRIQQTLEYAELIEKDVLAAAARSGGKFSANLARPREAAA